MVIFPSQNIEKDFLPNRTGLGFAAGQKVNTILSKMQRNLFPLEPKYDSTKLVFFLMFQKYKKDTFVVNYLIILIWMFFETTNVVFIKVLVLSMPLFDKRIENCSQ